MGEMNRKQNEMGWREPGDADLDRALDAALAKYAAVEPRAGLEERVLASLRAERTMVADRSWWRWGLAAVATMVVLVVAGLVLRSGKQLQPLVKNPPSVTMPVPQKPENPETRVAKHNGDAVPQQRHQPRHKTVAHSAQPEAVASVVPKLDQFPSPRPLSEQERILASYIAQNPERAGLIAQARMELLRRDQEEKLRDATDGSGDSSPQNSQH
jgi:hypothetical protein